MKNRRKDVFQLVLGAVMLGIFLGVYVAIPVGNGAIQSVVIVIASLPVTLYTLYCGTKKALLVVAAGLLLSMVFLQPLLFIAYGAPALVMGLLGGWIIGKGRNGLSVFTITVLHLLQTGLELLLSQLMSGIPFADRFAQTVKGWVMMLAAYVKTEEILIFARDFFFCCIPVAMIGAALFKGIITCYFVSVITKNKYVPYFRKENRNTDFSSMGKEKTYAGIFLGILGGFIPIAVLFVTGTVPYHFAFPACTVVLLCCEAVYLYYYYMKEIYTRELSKKDKIVRTGLLVIFSSFAVVIIAVKEIFGKQNRGAKDSV